MQRPEQLIQKAAFDHLRTRGAAGIFAWHTPLGGYRRPVEASIFKSLGSVAGIPDVLILHKGQLYCLELKSESGKVTPVQEQAIARLSAAGAICGISYSLDGALAWLEQMGLLRGAANIPRQFVERVARENA